MNDREVVEAILRRDPKVTQQFLYIKCYPLFKSIYDNYYTDCQSCVEFINEIYLHLITPNSSTHLCKLQLFQFASTLITWLKTVAVYYCYEHFRRKSKIQFVEEKSENKDYVIDRFSQYASSISEEGGSMASHDLEAILEMMPNKRYSRLIRLLYVEGFTKEETAAELELSMANFYNLHLRAKNQFNEIIKKEERYGELY